MPPDNERDGDGINGAGLFDEGYEQPYVPEIPTDLLKEWDEADEALYPKRV